MPISYKSLDNQDYVKLDIYRTIHMGGGLQFNSSITICRKIYEMYIMSMYITQMHISQGNTVYLYIYNFSAKIGHSLLAFLLAQTANNSI